MTHWACSQVSASACRHSWVRKDFGYVAPRDSVVDPPPLFREREIEGIEKI